MERCSRCIVPASPPGVTLVDGLCDCCRRHDLSPRAPRQALGRDRLAELLDSKPRGQYDSLVPLSGGKDSSFILYYLVRELGRKPLAAFMDNGYSHEMARRNVRRVCDALGVDLVVGKATEFRRRLVRLGLEIKGLLPKSSTSAPVCANCENNLRTFAVREAAEKGIPFIVWGATDFEDDPQSLAGPDGFRQRFGGVGATLGRIRRAASTVWAAGGMGKRCRLLACGVQSCRLRIRDNIRTGVSGIGRKLNPFMEAPLTARGAEVVYFFDYIPYDPYRNVQVLREELGWEAPAEGEMRMDCRLHVLTNYWNLERMGITLDGFVHATLVRHGLMERADALRKEEALREHLEDEYRAVVESVRAGDGG